MDKEKYVDEGWKESVAQEKGLQGNMSETRDMKQSEEIADVAETDDANVQQEGELEVNFFNYITSLVFQIMIFLGEIPNPMDDNKVDINLKQAKFLIDTLILLREKTKGNLEQEEENILNASIYELELKYVDRSKANIASS